MCCWSGKQKPRQPDTRGNISFLSRCVLVSIFSTDSRGKRGRETYIIWIFSVKLSWMQDLILHKRCRINGLIRASWSQSQNEQVVSQSHSLTFAGNIEFNFSGTRSVQIHCMYRKNRNVYGVLFVTDVTWKSFFPNLNYSCAHYKFGLNSILVIWLKLYKVSLHHLHDVTPAVTLPAVMYSGFVLLLFPDHKGTQLQQKVPPFLMST